MTVPVATEAAGAIGDRVAAKKAAAAPRKRAAAPRKRAAAPQGAARRRAPVADTSFQRRPPVQRSRGAQRQQQAKKTLGFGKGFKLPGAPSGARKVVVAEFIACVVLIGLTPVLMRKPKDGKLYVPNDFVRLTAVSLLFLILALLSSGQKTARIAAAFGGLVTLGVAFNASQSFKAIGAIFTNAQSGTITGAAASKDVLDLPDYVAKDLSGSPSDTGGGGKKVTPRPTTPGGSTPAPTSPLPTGPFEEPPPGSPPYVNAPTQAPPVEWA